MLRGSKPGSVLRSLMKLFTSRPAPISRTSESATSETTSRLCIRLRPRPSVAPRPPSLSDSFMSIRALWMAGASPKRTPVKSVAPSVKPSTGRSRLVSPKRGTSCGMRDESRATPQSAKSRPSRPPTHASSVLSVSNWRMMRARLAPSATRTAISRPRPAARASNRFATLAHAIKSTNPTAPSRTSKVGRKSPTNSSCAPARRMPMPAFGFGYSCWRRPMMAPMSACA